MLMSDKIICVCSQGDSIKQMQKDVAELKISNGEIREKLFNGISTDMPLIRKAITKMTTAVTRLEAKAETPPGSNKRPKIPRIVGTITIVLTFVVACTLAAWFLIGVGAIKPEDIGKIIGVAIP